MDPGIHPGTSDESPDPSDGMAGGRAAWRCRAAWRGPPGGVAGPVGVAGPGGEPGGWEIVDRAAGAGGIGVPDLAPSGPIGLDRRDRGVGPDPARYSLIP